MSRRITSLLLLAAMWLLSSAALAHEFRPGSVRLVESGQGTVKVDARWPVMTVRGPVDSPPQLVPPDGCARRSVTTWTCGVDGLRGETRIDGLGEHPMQVMVTVEYADGRRTVSMLGPDEPTLTLSPSASGLPVVGRYLRLGVVHVLTGFDHLAFVLGLILLARARRPLLGAVTAFTVAHSLTLGIATSTGWSLPAAPVEVLIAASIVVMALEALRPAAREGHKSSSRMVVGSAFGFGLLHGFGFAGALAEVGWPPADLPGALLGFNLGVEAGQLAVVLAFCVVLALAGSGRRAAALRVATAYAIGILGVAWTLQRLASMGGWV